MKRLLLLACLVMSMAGLKAQTDLTSKITNPSFETGNFSGWTEEGMAIQNNNVFSIKNGTYYVERWTDRGGAVGDGLVSQTLTSMQTGRYRLQAVAQNIQENSASAAQSGACIFAGRHEQAVTTRKDYTLEFVLVSDELTLGFRAKAASGNWLSVDHFRLTYLGADFAAVKSEFEDLIAAAVALAAKRMNALALQALQAAISTAQGLVGQGSDDGWGAAARALEAAYVTGETSEAIFGRLGAALTEARSELEGSSGSGKADYQTAINAAQQVYDNDATTDAEAEAAITALAKATFAFRVANGSGQVPKVVTDPRYIRGCTWAFGRSSVQGSNIVEQGFCWAVNPDPKVTDERTTEYINQAGMIYWLRDLKPATVYYMRAYALTKDYAVGYGDVIKFVTVPKGTVGHWYNNGGDEATNDRLNYAIDLSMDYYWNNLTSIHGFGITVNYSPGTPTADCSYGGWMRVGESSSYQQPGTIMHEAFHGIGVGTHDIWWNGEMRSAGNRGDWLGDRVTEAVRFWDNSATAVITGDDMHLWPYGCNGAHEDTHNDQLYCMMGILAQALNEDGLPASGEIGYALPYYAFNHEDGVKYYIKNEDKSHGLHTAYLVETATHALEWQTMDAEEAATNDAAAWYLTFTPNNQYYQLRNAATGYYITYASGFKTVKRTTPTAADNIHLMRGRVEVEGHRGYYFIHPESSATPPTLTASASGKTGSTQWNIAKSATTQRWLILTAEEAAILDNGSLNEARKELETALARLRQLYDTPHTETAEGVDAALTEALATIEGQKSSCTKGSEFSALTEQAHTAMLTFLKGVSATDVNQPFDITFMLVNPDFDEDATTGWTSTNGAPGYDAQCAEFYERTFNFYQNLTQMPKGVYQLRANAFQRAGETQAAYAKYAEGQETITTQLYINGVAKAVASIFDDRQSTRLYNNDIQVADNTYVPCVMSAASTYFAKGLYDSYVNAEVKNTTLRVGIRCTKTPPSYYWSIFDHFRLYFFGQNREPVGIHSIENGEGTMDNADNGEWFDLSGRRINSKLSTLNSHGASISFAKAMDTAERFTLNK